MPLSTFFSRRRILAAAVLSLVATAPTRAQTITFEGLANNAPIANGFAGFNWTDFYSLNGPAYGNPGSGYPFVTTATSSTMLAYNPSSLTASFSRATAFNFTSATVVAAWRNNLSLTVLGYDDHNVQLFSKKVTLSNTAASTLAANFTNVYRVQFVTSDGDVPASTEQIDGQQFGIDNIVIGTTVPEPRTVVLLAAGLLGLGVAARRRAR